jgi:hypothetical protein
LLLIAYAPPALPKSPRRLSFWHGVEAFWSFAIAIRSRAAHPPERISHFFEVARARRGGKISILPGSIGNLGMSPPRDQLSGIVDEE